VELRCEHAESAKTRLKLVPNQAFYQAEPQPDLVVSFCANAARLITSRILQRMARSMRSGRTIFVADAHRDDGKRFVVRADEKMTAFVDWNRNEWSCSDRA